MIQNVSQLAAQIKSRLSHAIQSHCIAVDELTLEVVTDQLKEVCFVLRDEEPFRFNQLMDVCGVDYLYYGASQWKTEGTTATGFSRAVGEIDTKLSKVFPQRFAAVYHLLSTNYNQRVRLKVFLKEEEPPMVDSVVDIWPSANWYEREAFDLYGIFFKGHPDLRRILTDYGFIGHPFRKDFPLIGQVEMRYDAGLGRCVYEPVSIQDRTLVPKVIRTDPFSKPHQGESHA